MDELQNPTRDDMVPGTRLMHHSGQRMRVVGEKRIGQVTAWAATTEPSGRDYTILPNDLPRYYILPVDESGPES